VALLSRLMRFFSTCRSFVVSSMYARVSFRVVESVLQVVWLNFAVAVRMAISSSMSWNIRWSCLCLKGSFSGWGLFCILFHLQWCYFF
jgi:hypothetical protein